jgi:hypothetical protein
MLGRLKCGETSTLDVDDADDTTGECTPNEDAGVLSKRRNEVAMASLIMKQGGGMKGGGRSLVYRERERGRFKQPL